MGMTNFSAAAAKIDMIENHDNVFKMIWWNFVPGRIIKMPWPIGWTRIDQHGNQFYSNDPNDHWRPWLETNVGKQMWDWDWKLSNDCQHVDIKFRRGKQDSMTLFLLQWM